jgi:hypothetical protein
MLFWMRNKKEPSLPNQPATTADLMSKIVKLRQENEDKERKLLSIKDTV